MVFSSLISAALYFAVLCVILNLMNQFVLKPNRNTSRLSLHELNQNIHLSLAIFYITLHTLTVLGVNPKISVYFLVVLTISKLSINFYCQSPKNILTIFSGAPLLAMIIVFALWIQLPGIFLSNKFGVLFGMVTTGNNDVASYAMVGQEFLSSGFDNSGRYEGYDINFQAETFSYQAPNILVSIFSTILNLKVWQVMTLVMIFAIALSILALASILEVLTNTKVKAIMILASAFICSIPLLSYLIGNYFLGQILALSVSASLLSLSMKTIRYREFEPKDGLFLSGLTVLASMTYPHLLLPFLLTLMAVTFVVLSILQKQIPQVDIRRLLASLFLGLIFSSIVLWKTKDFILKIFSMTGNGWALEVLTPQSIAIDRNLIGLKQTTSLIVISWLLFVTLVIWLMYHAKRPDGLWFFSTVLLFGFGLGTLMLILLRDLPLTNYTNWKLISYIAPLFLVIIVGYLIELRRILGAILILFSAVLAVTPTLDWMLTFRNNTGSVTRDMQNLSSSKILEQYSKINIDVNPYFETMAISSIVSTSKVNLVNPNYYFQSQNVSACTIVRRDNRKYGTFVNLNKTYGLTQSIDETCGFFVHPHTPSFEVPSEIDFSLGGNGEPVLVDGWSVPESWGVWSEGSKSLLRFKLTPKTESGFMLTLNGFTFDVPDKNQQVDVSINGKFFMRIDESSKLKEDNFKLLIPKDLIIKQDNRIEVSLKVSSPTSPQELGMSNDKRMLGFGLVSITLEPLR
jgi:hypothetical protein